MSEQRSNRVARKKQRSGTREKENELNQGLVADDNVRSTREAGESKRKIEELTKTVDTLKRDLEGLHKKVMTETAVQVMISEALMSHAPNEATVEYISRIPSAQGPL